MKKLSVILLCLVLFLGMVTMIGCSSADPEKTNTDEPAAKTTPHDPVKLQISTASTSGAFYNAGLAIGQTVTNNSGYIMASAAVSAGSGENVELLRTGETSIGCVQTDVFIDAHNGTGTYKESYDDLCILMPILSQVYHPIVRNGSGIETSADMVGKNVAIGVAGSGNAVTISCFLNSFGLTADKFKASTIGPTEAFEAMQNGMVDWLLTVGAYPLSSVANTYASNYGHIYQMSDEEIAKMKELYSFMMDMTIPAGTYTAQDVDISTLGHIGYLACDSSMDEQVAYDFVMTTFANLEEVGGMFNVLQSDVNFLKPASSIKVLTDAGVTLHPGAEKAYKELGLL